MSLGTAKSIIRTGLQRRALTASSTAPLPKMGNWLPVELITTSASGRRSVTSANKMASASNCEANCSARSSVRFAMMSLPRPASRRCLATSSIVSPAPSNNAVLCSISRKICRARSTAAYATDTGFSPIAVSVRTFLAILKASGKIRFR